MEVKGFENYLIYTDGKIWSKKSKKYLKHINDKYYKISLYKDKKAHQFLIHRLLAEHYIPNPENLPFVDHINRIKTDNRIENLRWVSISENGQNVGNYISNTSGHKNISFNKLKKVYYYEKDFNGKRYRKYFKNIIDAICYKFIMILKINSGLI